MIAGRKPSHSDAVGIKCSIKKSIPGLTSHIISACDQNLCKSSMHLHLSRPSNPIERSPSATCNSASLPPCWLVESTGITTDSSHRSQPRTGNIPCSFILELILELLLELLLDRAFKCISTTLLLHSQCLNHGSVDSRSAPERPNSFEKVLQPHLCQLDAVLMRVCDRPW